MSTFNFSAPAELFVNDGGRKRRSMTCKRFDQAAEAVRYVSEELPASNAGSAVIEVDEIRYRHPDILHLYNSNDYPLSHRQPDMRRGPPETLSGVHDLHFQSSGVPKGVIERSKV